MVRFDRSCLVSFVLASNRPALFCQLVENLKKTAKHPERIEVVVLVDDGDISMLKAIKQSANMTGINIKYYEYTKQGFFNLWDGLNKTYKLCNQNAKFVNNINDEIRFITKGWDVILESYVGIFEDEIFRLRISKVKLRNYHDLWECGFAPENYSFTSKRWIDIQGDWGACHGPDAFQQFVSYYLTLIDQPSLNQTQRDIPIFGIDISGEGMSIGLKGDALRYRTKKGWKAWYRLLSVEMQTECKRRACYLYAHIEAFQNKHRKYYLNDNVKNKVTEVRCLRTGKTLTDANGRLLIYSYQINTVSLILKNNWRKLAQDFYVGSNQFSSKLRFGLRDFRFLTVLKVMFFSVRQHTVGCLKAILDLKG